MNIKAITAGLQGVSAGEDKIEQRRQLQRNEARSDVVNNQSNQMFEVKLSQMEQALAREKRTNLQERGRNALKGYASGGGTYSLNRIAKDPDLRKTFGNYTSYSMQDNVLMGTKLLEDGSTKVVPVPKEQLTQWLIGTGVQQELDADVELKAKTKADTEYKEAQTSGKIADTQQQTLETQNATTWLQNNPDKTYTDYKNQGKTNSMTTASLKNEYANLRVGESNGSLTKDQTNRLGTLTQLFSTDNDEKRKILTEGMTIVDKYKGKLLDGDTNITDDDITNAKLYNQQSGIKPDTKSNRELKDQYNTVKNGYRLVNDIADLKPEELSQGMADTGIQELKKVLSDTAFESLSTEDKEKALLKIKTSTKLGMFLAKYIKSVSGTAVAEAEYMRLSELFSGNSFDNIQTLRAGVNTFVGELDTQLKDTLETSLLDNPATALDLAKRYKSIHKPMPQIQAPKKKPANFVKPTDLTSAINYSKTATNPNTGEKMGLTDNGWEIIK